MASVSPGRLPGWPGKIIAIFRNGEMKEKGRQMESLELQALKDRSSIE